MWNPRLVNNRQTDYTSFSVFTCLQQGLLVLDLPAPMQGHYSPALLSVTLPDRLFGVHTLIREGIKN